MQHETEQQDGSGYTITRILALSPEQNEGMRRNFSRVYIMPGRENIIDVLLFQGSRAEENFLGVIGRAIAQSGLKVKGDDLQVRQVQEASGFGACIFQTHYVTNGWLIDEDNEAYDLYVELEGLPLGNFPDMEVYDPITIEDSNVIENPICIRLGIENLNSNWAGEEAGSESTQLKPRPEPEVVERGGQGRVTDPSTDRRLKENRPPQMAVARSTQDDESLRDTGGAERQAGKPGRVRYRMFDGRLKENRATEATLAGR